MHLDVLAAGQAHDAADSKPCSAISRSFFCRPMQTRFVTMYAIIGPRKNSAWSTWMTPSIVSLKCVAMRSELAAAQSTA